MDCTEAINLSMAEYESIRSSSSRFPIAIGHEFADIENIVEMSDGYAVVQKKGAAAEEAARLDPRSR
jgi:5-bromo-4-chloroindolyl phosphate hydrolysis protein